MGWTWKTASRAAAVVLCCAMAGLASAQPASDPLSEHVQPTPLMGPQQVVRVQLEALRRNTPEDRGIEVAFRFASPGNKLNTGPLSRFTRMIKDEPYALMLHHLDASYGPLKIDGDVAAQQVTLIDADRAITYVFYLSRQKEDGPLSNCWMTDGVAVLPIPGQPA